MEQQNQLLEIISGAGVEQGLDQLVFPARDLAERRTVRASQLLGEEGSKRDNTTTRVQGELGRRLVERDKLRESCRLLNSEYSDAFPFEKEAIRNAMLEMDRRHTEANEAVERIRRPILESETRIKQTRAQLEEEHKFITKLLERFPEAKFLDLSCLWMVRDERGLPALTLFGLEKPESTITVRASGTSLYAPGVYCGVDGEVGEQLAARIEEATGVKSSDLQFRSGWERTEGVIQLVTTFPSGKLIPAEMRKLIREAQASGIFSCIALLAEAGHWQVRYFGEPKSKPKIEGQVILPPQTDDPIILGIQRIGESTLAFMLGAFDVTPIERYTAAEFTANAMDKAKLS